MSDPVENDYDPRYVEFDDVPVAGPDDYTTPEKRKAIFMAESSLELDVNDGSQIAQSELINAHRTAVMNLATHVLTHSAENPSDVTLGDMQSGGGGIAEYSSRYLEEYNRIVDGLLDTESTGHGNFSVSVNTGSSRAEGAEEPNF